MPNQSVAYFISLDSIHCKKWIKHLSKNNKCIIVTYEGMLSDGFDFPENKIFDVLPKRFPVKNFILRWLTIAKVWLVLKRNKVTLIHSMYCYPNAIWANYFPGYKKIITTRGSDVLIDYKNIKTSNHSSLIYLKNKLEQAFRDCAFITSTSVQQKNYLIEQGLDAAKISVIRTGIEPEHYHLEALTEPDTKIIRIISPRSVQKNYNIHNILLAIKHILNSIPQLEIHFDQVLFNINEDYLKSLNQLIEEKDLKKQVRFIQPYDLKSVSSTYSKYDLAIMIPSSDGTPVSALEVMIHKLPLIISNLPYDKDLINDELCWFVDATKPEEIANAILKIRNYAPGEMKHKLDLAYNNVLKTANTYNEMKKVTELYKIA